MKARAVGQSWSTDEAQGATFVELFFDLVFVFAVTSITSSILHDLDWSGVGHNALILWLVWWAWTQFTWTLNPADTTHSMVRLVTLGATAAAFFMAQAIPDAFDDGGGWFALSYVLVRILGLGLQLGVASQIRENARTVLTWIAGSSVGLFVVAIGGFVPSPAREIFWSIAVALDIFSAARAGRGRWALHAGHFAERHGLIVIIALGESLIAAGVALGDVERDAAFAIGTVAAVFAVCALWWIYFGRAKDHLEEHLASSSLEEMGGRARDIYSLAHLPIIAGIISFAVAIEQVLAHPEDDLGAPALVAMVAGTLLYMGGIVYGLQRCGKATIGPWAATDGAIAGAVAVAAGTASALVVLVVLASGLVAAAAWLTRPAATA